MAWKEIAPTFSGGNGKSMFVRYGELTPGEVVVEGTYKERKPSNFSEPDNPKFDHVFELADGSTKILNSASDIDRKLNVAEFGSVLRVTYVGKETAKGKKGTFTKHTFRVEGEAADEPF